MRRHDPQQHQQPKTGVGPGVYSVPDTVVGDPGVDWALTFLAGNLDPRGRAIVSCARFVVRRHRIDLKAALALARDVLSGETEEHCEALAVLLDGGWDGALGDAVGAARRI